MADFANPVNSRDGGTMTNKMDVFEILSRIDRGGFVFKTDNPDDLREVEGFQSVVQVIRALEKQQWVRVNAYIPSRKQHKSSQKWVDRVLVEYLTRDGIMALRRHRDTESAS